MTCTFLIAWTLTDLWPQLFNKNSIIKIYSFDVRGKPLNLARHWSAPEIFGSRAKFNTETEPATLDIDDIRRHDEGIFRCRVDFRTSQTQSFRYNLTVISKSNRKLQSCPII